MHIPDSVVSQLIGRAEALHATTLVPADCSRINVQSEIDTLRGKLQVRIENQLQPYFLLLDESIQFFVQFERFLFEKPLSSNLASFAVMVSKLKRDVVSIRELLAFGQGVTAEILTRTYIEDIEIAMALALSPEDCQAFALSPDSNAFWNSHIGYGKVYTKMHQFLIRSGVTEAFAEKHVNRHREAKKKFSDSVHGGRTSSLLSAFVPSLNGRDVHHLSLGALTYSIPQLALFVAQEAHGFSGSLFRGMASPEPLHIFREFRWTGRFANAVVSAFVLQELVVHYENELLAEADRFQTGGPSGG